MNQDQQTEQFCFKLSKMFLAFLAQLQIIFPSHVFSKSPGIVLQYLGNVFQPASKGNENKQHRRRIKKCDWTLLGPLAHGYNQHNAGVHIRDSGGQNNEHIHVGHPVSQRTVGLDIEVATSKDLKQGERER